MKIIHAKILENVLINELGMNAHAGLALLGKTVRIVSSISFCIALEFYFCCFKVELVSKVILFNSPPVWAMSGVNDTDFHI